MDDAAFGAVKELLAQSGFASLGNRRFGTSGKAFLVRSEAGGAVKWQCSACAAKDR